MTTRSSQASPAWTFSMALMSTSAALLDVRVAPQLLGGRTRIRVSVSFTMKVQLALERALRSGTA
jgi:hypothetical protein